MPGRMKPRTATRMAWSIATIEIVAVLGSLLLRLVTPNELLPPLARAGSLDIAENLTVLGGTLVGALVASRQPRNPLGWLFLAAAFGLAFSDLATIYVARGVVVEPGSLPLIRLVGWMGNWMWGLGVGSLPFLTLLFPTGRPHSPRWRPVLWAAGVVGILVVGVAMAIATQIWTTPLLAERAWPDTARSLVSILFGALPAILALALLGAVSMVFRYRAAGTEERLQLKWVIAGAIVLIIALAFDTFAEGTLVGVAALIGSFALYAALVIAILKYRLYDIDLVINKTLVYGALAAFITAVYVGVVVGIGTFAGTRGDPNLGLQVAATGLVAVLFQPVRGRIQRLANRLVYGARSTPYEVMAAFGERMAGSLRVEGILPQMAEAAARGVGAAGARVRLELSAGRVRESSWPPGEDPAGMTRTLPIVHRGEALGEISVTKAPGDPLRPQDEALLQDLAAQAGLALHNVRLAEDLRARIEQISRQAQELRASQQRIVTAGDDERRRLERTIEDRVERRIDGLAERLRGATGLLEVDPDACAAALEEAGVETQITLEELRSIAHGIYPPLLADKGLTAALDAQARRASGRVHVRADDVGRYSQEIEAGVYFCCVEAMQQAEDGVTILLREEGPTLRFTIEVGRPLASGQLIRIGDRVDALGGDIEIAGDGRSSISLTIPTAPVPEPRGTR